MIDWSQISLLTRIILNSIDENGVITFGIISKDGTVTYESNHISTLNARQCVCSKIHQWLNENGVRVLDNNGDVIGSITNRKVN